MYQMRKRSFCDDMYIILFPLVVLVFILGGLYLKNCNLPAENRLSSVTKIEHARFVFEKSPEMAIPKEIKPQTKVQTVNEEKEVVDLTTNPELRQEVEEVQEKVPDAPVVKKVYGLRKVYSTGLGSGGSLSEAVIGKLGNSLNVPVDTVKASKEDIKGQIVSSTTVTSAPQFLKIVKPEYSREMIDNKTEGVVKVKVLVDIDGKVKKAAVLSDLGFNSGNQALKATFEMEFTPAKRGDEAVAVWIIIPVRFVMLG